MLSVEAPSSARTLPAPLQMFPRQQILRRLVACMGIALALLTSVQESHALCAIAGCTADCHIRCDDCQHDAVPTCTCCRHEAANLSHDTGFVPQDPVDDGDPCGPKCFRSQPCPRDVPRNVSQSLQSRLASLVATCLPMQSGIDFQFLTIHMRARAFLNPLVQSSGSTCALLCRFLT
jgi:hypothetical protein